MTTATAISDGRARRNATKLDPTPILLFLLSGTLQPKLGGAILAHQISLEQLQARLAEDPFVSNSVVSAEILQISPSKTADPLAFLMA